VLTGLLAKAPEARPSGERLRQLLRAAGGGAEAATVADRPAVAAGVATEPYLTAAEPVAAAGAPSLDGRATPSAPTRPYTVADQAGAGPQAAGEQATDLAEAAGLPSAGERATGSGRTRHFPSMLPHLAVILMIIAVAALARAVRDDPPSSKGRQGTTATPTSRAPAAGAGAGTSGGTGTPTRLELAKVAPPGQVLPRFWLSATNQAGGYRMGVPASFWDVIAEGPTTYLEWREPMFQAAFELRSYPKTRDPYEQLRGDAAAFAERHRQDQYKQVRLTRNWTYRRGPAAAWEYTWVRNGELARARVVAFQAGSHTYTVLYRSKDLWWNAGGTSDYPTGFEQAFTPLTAPPAGPP
jgi:hypothetical protein